MRTGVICSSKQKDGNDGGGSGGMSVLQLLSQGQSKSFFFFLNDPPPPEIYPLSLPAALPILSRPRPVDPPRGAGDLSEGARAARGRDARPRRPPRRRDRLPLPAAPAPPGPAQRARLPHDHRRARGRAAWRSARRARGPHVGERPPALPFVSLRDLRLYVRGRIKRQLSRELNARGGGSP